MRKPDFCLCENKGADQLRSNCEADQRLCFRYSDSTILLLLIAKTFKPLACFCHCTGRFVSDLVGNPEDRFSRVAAHLTKMLSIYRYCDTLITEYYELGCLWRKARTHLGFPECACETTALGRRKLDHILVVWFLINSSFLSCLLT